MIFLSTPNLLFLATVLYKIYDTQTSNLYSLVIPPHVIHDFTDMFRIESLLLKLLQTSLDSSHFADSSKSDLTPGPWILMELYQRIYMDTEKLLAYRCYLPSNASIWIL